MVRYSKAASWNLPPKELAFVELGKKETNKHDELSMALLNSLRKKTDAEGVIFGFKDFWFNLTWVKIYQQMLNSKGGRKVFLFRNPIDRYTSMERADLAGVFVFIEKNKDAGLDLKRLSGSAPSDLKNPWAATAPDRGRAKDARAEQARGDGCARL